VPKKILQRQRPFAAPPSEGNLMTVGLIVFVLFAAPSSRDAAPVAAQNLSPAVRPVANHDTLTRSRQRSATGIEHEGPLPLTQLPVVVVSKDCPTREESAVVALWEDGRISMTVTADTGVARSFDVCKGIKELLGRVFDLAYEQKSGDAIITCYDADNRKLVCRVFDGASVEKSQSIRLPVAMRVGYLAMRARPNSDDIVLMLSGVASDGKMHLYSNEWNGDRWADWQIISADLARDESKQPAAEWSAPPQDAKPDAPRK